MLISTGADLEDKTMAELESVMTRLDVQTKRLKERSLAPLQSAGDDAGLTLETLALFSEAVLKIGRDIRAIRLQLADK